MTTQITPLVAGRELDALVAEKVFKIKVAYPLMDGEEEDRQFPYYVPSGKPWRTHGGCDGVPLPQFSTSIAAAWEVVERIKSLTRYGDQEWPTRQPWLAFCDALSNEEDGFNLNFWSVDPRTISLAALNAVGVTP